MNALVKDFKDVFVAGTPAAPAVAAYDRVIPLWVCSIGGTGDIIVSNWKPPMAGYHCEYQQQIVHVPAVPARPAVPTLHQTDMRFGWNAGARSVQAIAALGASDMPHLAGFQFTVPANVLGVVVGLTLEDTGTTLADYKAGFYFSQGYWQPIENGVIQPFIRNAYTEGDVFALQLFPGTVLYQVNDSTYYGGSFSASAPVYLDTAMFSGGDKVLNAQILSGGGQNGVMAALRGHAFQGAYGRGDGKFAPLRGDGGIRNGQRSAMSALRGLGSWTSSFGVGVMPAMTGGASGGIQGPLNFGVQLGAMVAPLSGGGVLRSGFSGGGDGLLQPLQSYAHGGASFATQQRGVMAPAKGIGWGFEGSNNATIGTYCMSASDMLPITNTFVTLHSTGRMLAMFDVTLMVPAQIASQANARSMMLVDASVLAYIDSVVQAITNAHDQAEDVQVWVLNDRTGAMSQYKNYRFNSFAPIGGRYFGADHDGIYLLEGSTDGGEQIETSMRTGMLDLGTTNLKSISSVYLGVASEGRLSVVVETGAGESYRYLARSSDRASMQQRVDVGRGMKSTLYSFTVDGNGGDFELDSMDVNLAASARRI